MVSSLKDKYTTPLELIIGSTEFVKIFTDAANHIPRHRRTQYVVVFAAPAQSLTEMIVFQFLYPSRGRARRRILPCSDMCSHHWQGSEQGCQAAGRGLKGHACTTSLGPSPLPC